MTPDATGCGRPVALRALLRQPLLHFVALGALLFALSAAPSSSSGPSPNPLPVAVSGPSPNPLPAAVSDPSPNLLPVAGRGLRTASSSPPGAAVETARGTQEPTCGPAIAENNEQLNASGDDAGDAPPLKGEGTGERSLTDSTGDDEALYRLGLELGLDRLDPVVRRRLVQNARFLSEDPARDDDRLYRDALALGMDRTDLVVRRRVIALARQRLEASMRGSEPSDAELEAYLEQHADAFRTPARVRISHLFLSRDRRGARLAADAHALRARLEARHLRPQDTAGLGDPSLAPRDLPLETARQLEPLFGEATAQAIVDLEPGAWSGPLPAPAGVHLVWVHERVPARVPALAEVRNRVRDAVLAGRDAEALAATMPELRGRYGLEAGGGEGSNAP